MRVHAYKCSAYLDFAFAAVGAAFGRLAAVDHCVRLVSQSVHLVDRGTENKVAWIREWESKKMARRRRGRGRSFVHAFANCLQVARDRNVDQGV